MFANMPRVGMRMIKTSLAVAICFLLYFARGEEGVPVFSTIAAIIGMQPYVENSLQAAFELSMTPKADRELGEEEALLYGGYEPLSMAVSNIINNKAGLSYTSYAHTGLQIPVYAMGVGAEKFSGLYDNTEIFSRTMEVMGLEK